MQNEEIVRNYQNKFLASTPLYTDMAGGLNTRVSPPQLAVNQSQIARNVIYNVASGALSARDGTSRLNESADNSLPIPATSGVYALFQAKFSRGWHHLAVAGESAAMGVCALPEAGSAWTALTSAEFTAVPDSRRSGLCFYNDAVVIFDGINPPHKVTYTGAAPVLESYFAAGEAPAHLTDCEFCVVYNNKIYAAGSKSARLNWSDEVDADAAAGDLPEFPSANQLLVGGVSDSDNITGLAVAYGHLIIFKRNSIYALSESAGSPSITQVARSIGLIEKFAFCNAENSVWFFGPAGIYSIGSDLTPEFESDYILPDCQAIMRGFQKDFHSYPCTNAPLFAYNQDKQQVWVSVYNNSGATPDRNVVYVHDLINKDASGRSCISTYVFYQSDIRNYTPYLFSESTKQSTNELKLYSFSRKTEASDALLNNSVENPLYLYVHDVPLEDGSLGDDGNLVEWMWESKFFNLGDALRLKALRYYTIFGDPRDEVSTQYTNQTYSYGLTSQTNRRHPVLPVVARGASSVAVGGYIYSFGGIDSSGAHLRSIRAFNVSTGVWTTLAAQLGASGLAFSSVVHYNGDIFLIGGSTAADAATDGVYKFNISAPGVLTAVSYQAAVLDHDVVHAAADVLGQYAYVFGGTTSSKFDRIDLTTLQPAVALTAPGAAGSTYGGSLVQMSSGGTDYFFLIFGQYIYRYNVSLGTWKTSLLFGTLPNAFFRGAYTDGTYIYAYGGSPYSSVITEGTPSAQVFRYTPSFNAGFTGDALSVRAPLASPRSLFGSAYDSSTKEAYYIGGTGFAIRAYFSSTDDFKLYSSVDTDVVLNVRSLVPAGVNYLSRYWGITFRGRLSEGIARVTGFCFDYVMFQRRG